MNSMPAASSARRTAKSLAAVSEVSPSVSSARRIVAPPPADSRARSSARHRRKARAALIWPLVRGRFFTLTCRDMRIIIRSANDQTEEIMKSDLWTKPYESRRSFIGGSDARIIMGSDEAALVRLWREKRGEAEPEDLSGNLIVQLGSATEELNRSWYERNTGRRVRDMQRRVRHSAIAWMVATLDGIVEGTEAVFESKFMLPWSFSEEAAAEKYMPQLQHNMWVTHLRTSVLSIITGGGKW